MNKLLCSWVFSILVINLVLFNTFADEKNLAYNSSFEEVLEEIPLYWYIWTFDQSPGASEFKVEKGPGLNGNNCAVIVNNKPNDARLIQNIEVKQNSKYKLSAWIKSQDVKTETLGANISVYGHLGTSSDIKGTVSEWQYVVLYVSTGEDITELPVSVGLGGHGNINTGVAWFDEISIEEVAAIPEGAKAINIGFSEKEESGLDSNSPNGSQGKYTWILLVFAIIMSSGTLYYYFLGKRGNIRVKNNKPL